MEIPIQLQDLVKSILQIKNEKYEIFSLDSVEQFHQILTEFKKQPKNGSYYIRSASSLKQRYFGTFTCCSSHLPSAIKILINDKFIFGTNLSNHCNIFWPDTISGDSIRSCKIDVAENVNFLCYAFVNHIHNEPYFEPTLSELIESLDQIYDVIKYKYPDIDYIEEFLFKTGQTFAFKPTRCILKSKTDDVLLVFYEVYLVKRPEAEQKRLVDDIIRSAKNKFIKKVTYRIENEINNKNREQNNSLDYNKIVQDCVALYKECFFVEKSSELYYLDQFTINKCLNKMVSKNFSDSNKYSNYYQNLKKAIDAYINTSSLPVSKLENEQPEEQEQQEFDKKIEEKFLEYLPECFKKNTSIYPSESNSRNDTLVLLQTLEKSGKQVVLATANESPEQNKFKRIFLIRDNYICDPFKRTPMMKSVNDFVIKNLTFMDVVAPVDSSKLDFIEHILTYHETQPDNNRIYPKVSDFMVHDLIVSCPKDRIPCLKLHNVQIFQNEKIYSIAELYWMKP